jgi:hypothetical protein
MGRLEKKMFSKENLGLIGMKLEKNKNNPLE